MNLIQRGIITVGLLLMILLVVYPPWNYRFQGEIVASEYSFIWSVPTRGRTHYTMDRDRLTLPWLTVLVATIGLVKVFESKRNNGGGSTRKRVIEETQQNP